jgi:hypothetical protein
MATTENSMTTTNTEEADTGSVATTEISTATTNTDIQDTGVMTTTEMSTTTTNAKEDDILKHIRETLTLNRIHAMVSVLDNCVHV